MTPHPLAGNLAVPPALPDVAPAMQRPAMTSHPLALTLAVPVALPDAAPAHWSAPV